MDHRYWVEQINEAGKKYWLAYEASPGQPIINLSQGVDHLTNMPNDPDNFDPEMEIYEYSNRVRTMPAGFSFDIIQNHKVYSPFGILKDKRYPGGYAVDYREVGVISKSTQDSTEPEAMLESTHNFKLRMHVE